MADEERMNQDMEVLKADIASLKRDIAHLSDTLGGMARQHGEGAMEAMGEGLEDVRERLRARYAAAREYGRRTVDDIEDNIGQHPLASMATAVGVGFIVAKLMTLGARR